ncbi:MAG TPA: hypothetical protein PKD54_13425, partial [Pirellulaceae bacterium]|nr:hypothetical protein [Pirellulaceae bacterium]
TLYFSANDGSHGQELWKLSTSQNQNSPQSSPPASSYAPQSDTGWANSAWMVQLDEPADPMASVFKRFGLGTQRQVHVIAPQDATKMLDYSTVDHTVKAVGEAWRQRYQGKCHVVSSRHSSNTTDALLMDEVVLGL